VKVRAAAVNPLDWHYVRGTPYLMRMATGLRQPKFARIGVDFSGTVEAVGSAVARFKPGDEVFGGCAGAFAEYVLVPEDRAVAPKPANLSFDLAAAVPIAATTALQGLRDQGKVAAGQKVLINGAAGGVGTFAVQIARSLGAEVTAVCSARNKELVRSLGATHVIDYGREDYVAGERRYDVVLDNVGNRSLGDNRRVLTPKGRYVLVGGGGPDAGRWLGPMPQVLGAAVMSKFVKQAMGTLFARLNAGDLAALAQLVQSGQLTPVIDRTYPLAEITAALSYLEQGHARGKVVVAVS
jgi:NADPH:quinone reductase-like Zn-dependent oxidoreductase